MNFKVETRILETRILKNGNIEQDSLISGKLVSRKIIDATETQLRNALIQLGWTPPDKASPEAVKWQA